MAALLLVLVWVALEMDRKRAQRQRLLADCEYQHWRLMCGDEAVGTYGTRYQPAPMEMVA